MKIDLAISQFYKSRRASGLADKTIEQSEYVMRDFIVYCNKNNYTDVEEIDEIMIEEYFVYLKYDKINKKHGGHLSEQTLACYFNVIRAFASFLLRRSYITKNIITVKSHTVNPGIKQTFSAKQLEYIVNNARKDYRILFKILANTGMRISEVLNLKKCDIHIDEYRVDVYRKKTKKYEVLPFSKSLKKELAAYLKSIESEYLFTMKADSVRRYLRRLCNGADPELEFEYIHVKPHLFRHTLAKNWIMKGGDAFSLQKMLGHSSPHMTSHYVNLFSSDLAEMHAKYALEI